ncbi:CLUMA_CG021662, isoform A [Clunio marinus]|uniref:CLUMA_CG021662, isoform A n=1 Tax=Clunio marinus TaxID=568069 RepID=A0A1J1J7H8_9DIPT|nr:CLUMA_CG021662, isoform A [Clunio marinus]
MISLMLILSLDCDIKCAIIFFPYTNREITLKHSVISRVRSDEDAPLNILKGMKNKEDQL